MLVARGPVEHEGEDESEPDGSVTVDATQRRRSRFRTRTDTGEEVGVVVDGAGVLSPGDRLVTDDGRLLVVELEAREALVVELGDEEEPTALVAAGHAIGNRHWDLVVRDDRLYVPADGEADHRRELLQAWLPSGSEVRVERVEPTVFDGSYNSAQESHTHDHSHDHDHGHSHTHDHVTDLALDRVRRAARGGEGDE
jgi:urease accessory protein